MSCLSGYVTLLVVTRYMNKCWIVLLEVHIPANHFSVAKPATAFDILVLLTPPPPPR